MALNIYLADLVYDTIKTNYVVSLNIGYITALLKEKFGKEVNVKLFKYPKILGKAFLENWQIPLKLDTESILAVS